MIKKKKVLEKYKISPFTFYRLVNELPEESRNIILSNRNNHFFTSKQAEEIKKCFGDYEAQCFKTKYEIVSLYGVHYLTFKKMLVEAFGKNSPFLINSFAHNFYTAKEVLQIFETIGEP